MAAMTRREALAGSAAASLTGAGGIDTIANRPSDRIAADLEHYAGLGIKSSGGAGDIACGDWIDSELRAAGYRTERQAFDVPWFEPKAAELSSGDFRAPLIPVAIVTPTPPAGVSGPMAIISGGRMPGNLAGAIALIDLPHARWSTATANPIREPVEAALAAGARGVALITNGPTQGALALNVPAQAPLFAGPTAVLAPRDAAPFLRRAQDGKVGTLLIDGAGARRSAFNVIGRINRGAKRWLVVSTPRSGWFGCAGERGPGVAVWLGLARWAAKSMPKHNLAFICNSGHEFEYHGAHQSLATLVPKPGETAFWLHLGANVATRDWHELGGGALLPLLSPDPQRFLVTSPGLVALARSIFAGEAGLEMPYPATLGSAGELADVIGAGYSSIAGIFGAHRYHHNAEDDSRTVSGPLAARVARACENLLSTICE